MGTGRMPCPMLHSRTQSNSRRHLVQDSPPDAPTNDWPEVLGGLTVGALVASVQEAREILSEGFENLGRPVSRDATQTRCAPTASIRSAQRSRNVAVVCSDTVRSNAAALIPASSASSQSTQALEGYRSDKSSPVQGFPSMEGVLEIRWSPGTSNEYGSKSHDGHPPEGELF